MLHFHQDRLYRAVVRITGITVADARGLAFRTMKLEEAGVRSGHLRVACWASEETRARLEYDPQRRDGGHRNGEQGDIRDPQGDPGGQDEHHPLRTGSFEKAVPTDIERRS